MKSKRILLISLLVIMIAAISMGTIAAASSEDINLNNTLTSNDITDTVTTTNDITEDTISSRDFESSENLVSADSETDNEKITSTNSENKLSATYTVNGDVKRQ